MTEQHAPWPELAQLGLWLEASDARREAIAQEVAARHPELEYRGLEVFADADFPIASFAHPQALLDFRLLPGGRFGMGFSEAEEALVRAAGEARPRVGNWYEEWGQLYDRLSGMRPVHEEAVAPLLMAASPIEELEVDGWRESLGLALLGEAHDEVVPATQDLGTALRSFGFRLPHEAEWEYAARGGRACELTFLGNTIPDRDHLRRLLAEDPSAVNRFGLELFGLHPEICADVFRQSYDEPRREAVGDEPRVHRGGAGMLAPWQDCGEWQLLLSASRLGPWPYVFALRLVIDP